MSINQSKSYHYYYPSKFAAVISVLRTRKYQVIILVSGLTYTLAYMFTLGIISYYPGLASITATYPMVRATSYGISIIPAPDVFIFIFYGALAFLVISSFLVGLNTSMIFYSRKLARSCRIKNNIVGTRAIFGIVPAFFTSFACCGGGLMALVIGPAVFSALAIYGKYMAPLTIAVLAIGTILMAIKISRLYYGSCYLTFSKGAGEKGAKA